MKIEEATSIVLILFFIWYLTSAKAII